jgi:hypothetical protein
MTPYFIKSVVWTESEVTIFIGDANNEGWFKEIHFTPCELEQMGKRIEGA